MEDNVCATTETGRRQAANQFCAKPLPQSQVGIKADACDVVDHFPP